MLKKFKETKKNPDDNQENKQDKENQSAGTPKTKLIQSAVNRTNFFSRDINIMPEHGYVSPKKSPQKETQAREGYEQVKDFLIQNIDVCERIQSNQSMLGNISQFIQHHLSAIQNPQLKSKMCLCIYDIEEVRSDISKLEIRALENFTRNRTKKQFLSDIVETQVYLRNSILYRCQTIFDMIKNPRIKEIFMEFISSLNTTIPENFSPIIDICFSQDNASDTFKASQAIRTSSNDIMGENVVEVGNKINREELDPEVLKVRIFRYNNRWVAENNRGFSAACCSGIFPLRILPTFPSQDILNAYELKLAQVENHSPHRSHLKSLKQSTHEEKLHSINLINDDQQITSEISSYNKDWQQPLQRTLKLGKD